MNKRYYAAVIFLASVLLSCAHKDTSKTKNDPSSGGDAGYGFGASSQSYDCKVDDSWLTHPSLPIKVATSGSDGSSTFCDFYRFSTQSYLYLMSMSSDGVTRNFQNSSNYPLLEFNSDGTPANSCDATVTGTTMRTSLDKSALSTEQAGSSATIYARDRNVVYYQVRFNKSLCGLTASAVEMKQQQIINFPNSTTEIKLAWKVLSAKEVKSKTFVTQAEMINGTSQTLGLVGMHLAIATTDHPEFVWATYEHRLNSPDCLPGSGQANSVWTFSDASCANGLPGSADPKNSCKYNQPTDKLTAPTGTPTNICRVHPYGTEKGDFKAGENLKDITEQNAQMSTLFKAQGAPKGMPVLANYFNVGDLWLSDINKNSGGINVPNERGSLRLANTVAETDFQDVHITKSFASNCFGCHNYLGEGEGINNNITSYSLSHTFRDIKIGQGLAIDISTSTIGKQIGDNSQASSVCKGKEGVCETNASFLEWNGSWTNANASAGSVCGCKLNN